MVRFSTANENFYTMLWGLVFGFATLNILSLSRSQLRSTRPRFRLGEILAVLIAITALGLLAWELLHQFHILPIQIAPR